MIPPSPPTKKAKQNGISFRQFAAAEEQRRNPSFCNQLLKARVFVGMKLAETWVLIVLYGIVFLDNGDALKTHVLPHHDIFFEGNKVAVEQVFFCFHFLGALGDVCTNVFWCCLFSCVLNCLAHVIQIAKFRI